VVSREQEKLVVFSFLSVPPVDHVPVAVTKYLSWCDQAYEEL